MEIAVNGKCFVVFPTGVQRYAGEILKRWPPVKVFVRETPSSHYPFLRRHILRKTRWGALFPGGGVIWEQLVLPLALRGEILWSPCGFGSLAYQRQVVTLHDVAHIEHPEWYGREFVLYNAWFLPKLAKRVKLILTVSEFSRERILEVFSLPEEKVISIPLGVNKEEFYPRPKEDIDHVRKLYGLEKPYVLAVSALSRRKNFERLLQAWRLYLPKDLDIAVVGPKNLHFAGRYELPEEVRRLPGVRYLGFVPEEHLPALYSGALVFAYVSLYEGFGLPVLEAMACGAPVITSNVTALPEVSGDAAFLVDPYDVEAISEGLKQLVENESLRTTLRQKGFERVQRYDWEKTSALTLEAILRA